MRSDLEPYSGDEGLPLEPDVASYNVTISATRKAQMDLERARRERVRRKLDVISYEAAISIVSGARCGELQRYHQCVR